VEQERRAKPCPRCAELERRIKLLDAVVDAARDANDRQLYPALDALKREEQTAGRL
jgi:hypothetical protein